MKSCPPKLNHKIIFRALTQENEKFAIFDDFLENFGIDMLRSIFGQWSKVQFSWNAQTEIKILMDSKNI